MAIMAWWGSSISRIPTLSFSVHWMGCAVAILFSLVMQKCRGASSCSSAPRWRPPWACRKAPTRRWPRRSSAKRPSVIWLHFQECTGCSESLLRAEHPTLEKLILDVISLDYHETLMAAAGHQAEAARKTR
jgi:hypothetical protein